MPRSTVVTIVIKIAVTRFCFIVLSQSHSVYDHVDDLYADERRDDSAEAVDEQVATQQRRGTQRTIFHSAQRERNERDDDYCVEDDRGQDRGLRRAQAH